MFHLILDATTHTGDEDDTAGRLEAAHLPACSLSSIQNTVAIHRHDLGTTYLAQVLKEVL